MTANHVEYIYWDERFQAAMIDEIKSLEVAGREHQADDKHDWSMIIDRVVKKYFPDVSDYRLVMSYNEPTAKKNRKTKRRNR